jgi:hypothetical protein
MISHSELVEDFFGYWPEFADARIVSFAWAQPGSMNLVLHYIDAEQRKDAIVSLRFGGATDVQLTDLKSENVLDRLGISAGSSVAVELEACYGLAGTFRCSVVEVTELAPNKSFKPMPLRGTA